MVGWYQAESSSMLEATGLRIQGEILTHGFPGPVLVFRPWYMDSVTIYLNFVFFKKNNSNPPGPWQCFDSKSISSHDSWYRNFKILPESRGNHNIYKVNLKFFKLSCLFSRFYEIKINLNENSDPEQSKMSWKRNPDAS